jgi:aspartate dehydrogenase
MSPSSALTLIGLGAIGRALVERTRDWPGLNLRHVVVTPRSVSAAQQWLGPQVQVLTEVPPDAQWILECAGHGAIEQHVLPALQRGIECALLSVGALASTDLALRLENAARAGQTQVHVLSGAIGGIDAIAAARWGGLSEVTYTGRKPPQGWRGSAAESVLNLDQLTQATVLMEGSAAEVALKYPKNANVAATIALAGLGLHATRARLIADPTVSENIHEIDVRGAFGQMQLTMRGQPLPENPKTSMLTVLSAMRYLSHRSAAMTL